MFHLLYNIFIMPIEGIVEAIFYYMNNIFVDEPGISIMFVSLVINILILPLYKRADDMQEKERDKQKSMERWNKHIHKTFKGDERYMMQTAYYRIEGYKPFYAITGSLSLLFQIPFFIAAYHFLSNLKCLNESSFLMIQNLGAPDGLIKLGAISINLLPILMTLINIVSGMIYTKGFKLKDKLQLYGMALLFLIVLYKSPAGLVLYWTCNNLFSLGKNILFKVVPRQRLAVNILSAFAGTTLFAWLVLSHRLILRRQYLVFGIVMLASYLPAILSLIEKIKPDLFSVFKGKKEVTKDQRKNTTIIFWLGAVLNTIILGVMVPVELIASAPIDFGVLVKMTPLELLLDTVTLYIGLLLVWMGIFYAISNDLLKKIFAGFLWIYGICSLVNYYFFFGKFGTMDYNLRFDYTPIYNDLGKLINLLVLLPIVAALVFILVKLPKVTRSILSVLIIMTIVLSGMSIYKTHKTMLDEGYYDVKKEDIIVPTVPISRDGHNVMVFMLDRAISEYVPYIFKEKPEIAKEFEDFVYYPNTISYGGCTNFATPALFGGYEYTPLEINARPDESLMEKHNEAILTIPVLLAENDYEVTVIDPPYTNYKEYPDVSLFYDYENITGHTTRDKYGRYEYNLEEVDSQKKHMMVYSLFRTVPVLLQNSIYDDGNYLGKPLGANVLPYCAEGYATLDYLDTYTYIVDDDRDRAMIMSNLLTHEPTWLETPEYVIGRDIEDYPLSEEITSQYVIDGKVLNMDIYESIMHYQVNVAAYKLLAKYFAYLKEEGIYDNTRIIIVSDHGWPVSQMDDVQLDEETNIETFNPVLMVKDFADSDAANQGEVRHLEVSDLNICDDFMTNADTAYLSVVGLIDEPINPFTGKEISNKKKYEGGQMVTTSRNFSVMNNNGNVFETDNFPWIEFLGGDVKDRSNWIIHYSE